MKPTITLRINYRDFLAMKRILKQEKDESVIDYFSRFIEYAKEWVQNDQ